MTVQLRAFTCGHLTIPLSFMLAGREGRVKVPITSYVIDHPRGRVMFDTGLHLASQVDPAAHVGDFLIAFHEFDYGAGEDVAARLSDVDVDPSSVTHVVNSHLHFDHCGGNALLPNATVVVQRREVEAASSGGENRGYLSADFETGQPFHLVDGEHDLFGDGSIVLFPTYGHTPGHQSMRVRTSTGSEYVLCGDACYLRESLESLTLPGVIDNAEAALASLQQFRRLRAGGARILVGHDPEFWAGVPQAPAVLG